MNLGMTRSGYRGATIEDAGDHNTRIVLRAIRAQGTLTKAELARQTGLAHPTVTNITRRLIERGLLRTAGMQRGGRGQPATRLVINGEGAHAIGLNGGCDHITMVLTDFAGTVKARLTSQIAYAQPEQVRSFYCSNLDRLLAMAGVEAGAITGIGLALPDGLGGSGQKADDAQWSAANLEALFAGPLDRPVFIEDEVAAAAMGEMQFGRGQREPNFFYVLISHGLRGGLVVGGQLDRGADGRSGQIGLMPVVGEGGLAAPLQSIASIAGLNQRLAQAGCAPFAQDAALMADAALQRVHDGWIEESARALVEPLVAVNLLINPGVVLVGGRLGLPLLERLTQRTNFLLRSAGGDAPAIAPVMPAALAENAAAVGAALLAFDDLALGGEGA